MCSLIALTIGKTLLLQEKESIPAMTKRRCLFPPKPYEGFKISVHSHIKAIQFLLAQGFQYVLSERFLQDVVEDYFSHQKENGGRSDNPTAQQFGYNNLTIAAQRDIAPVVRGNVCGRYTRDKWYTVSNELVHKRNRKKSKLISIDTRQTFICIFV